MSSPHVCIIGCSCGEHKQGREKVFFLFAYFSKLFTYDLLLLHWLKPQEARISMGIPLVADLS